MTAALKPTLPKWPFLLGDVLLLAVAGYICWQGSPPLSLGELSLLTVAVALAAGVGVAPFLLEHRGDGKLAELLRMERAVLQLGNIEGLTRQINSATAGWQVIQDEATKAVAAAQQTSELMSREAQGFQEFLAKANGDERNRLRLEVEKQRRAEHDWLLVLTGVLDHIYALNQAAARSGQGGLVDQLSRFQDACRELTRRVGLVAYGAEPGEPFAEEMHQLPEASQEGSEAAQVGEVLACGYRFQGQLVRKALVTLLEEQPEASPFSPGNVDLPSETERSDSSFAPQEAEPTEDDFGAEPSGFESTENPEERESAEDPSGSSFAVGAAMRSSEMAEEDDDPDLESNEPVAATATDLEAEEASLADPEQISPFVGGGDGAEFDEAEMVREVAEPATTIDAPDDSEQDSPFTVKDDEEANDELRDEDDEDEIIASAPTASATNAFVSEEVDAVFGPDPFGVEPESREVDTPEASSFAADMDAEELTQATWPDEEENSAGDDESEDEAAAPEDPKQGRLGFE